MAINKLKKKAKDNTTVVRKKAKEKEQVIKEGVPREPKSVRNEKLVGVAIGLTKNMDNYESLRVDCWLTDIVEEGETHAEAFKRVSKIAEETLYKEVGNLTE